MKEKTLISVRNLGRKREVEKSKLLFYITSGLLDVEKVEGNAFMLDEEKAEKALDTIDEMRKQGKTLREIKEKFDEDKQRSEQPMEI